MAPRNGFLGRGHAKAELVSAVCEAKQSKYSVILRH